jgi:hypothetical protein
MQIKGKVIQLLAPQSGQGKNGEWKKQDFILETEDQYPKKVCITIFGEKLKVSEGQNITAHINVESREYNEKWYTNITMWKFDQEKETQQQQQQSSAPDLPQASLDGKDGDDNLPF